MHPHLGCSVGSIPSIPPSLNSQVQPHYWHHILYLSLHQWHRAPASVCAHLNCLWHTMGLWWVFGNCHFHFQGIGPHIPCVKLGHACLMLRVLVNFASLGIRIGNILQWSWLHPKPHTVTPTILLPSLVGDSSRIMNQRLCTVSNPIAFRDGLSS